MYWFRGPSRAVLFSTVFACFRERESFLLPLLKAMIVGRSAPRSRRKAGFVYGAGDGGELLIRRY
jgi:hypothetical protein